MYAILNQNIKTCITSKYEIFLGTGLLFLYPHYIYMRTCRRFIFMQRDLSLISKFTDLSSYHFHPCLITNKGKTFHYNFVGAFKKQVNKIKRWPVDKLRTNHINFNSNPCLEKSLDPFLFKWSETKVIQIYRWMEIWTPGRTENINDLTADNTSESTFIPGIITHNWNINAT